MSEVGADIENDIYPTRFELLHKLVLGLAQGSGARNLEGGATRDETKRASRRSTVQH